MAKTPRSAEKRQSAVTPREKQGKALLAQAKPNVCFAIMPYEGSEDIDEIILQACRRCGLEYVRGDHRLTPGRVMPQVLRDIQRSSVVVADISGNNPNVFYELGIAHHVKGADRVIITTQSLDEIPFDLREFRQLGYKHTREGRAALRRRLPEALRAALATPSTEEQWDVVRGRLPRTKLIVLELEKWRRDASPRDLKHVTIRVVAGLGSLAISDREATDSDLETGYWDALLDERNKLRDLLARGARLKAVLNPPRRFAKSMGPTRLRARYERLIGLLEGRSDIVGNSAAVKADLAAIKQCDFVFTPVPMTNLFIIGDKVVFEGIKRGGGGGFEVSHCETRRESVKELVRQFNQLFDDSRDEMLRQCPAAADDRAEERKFLSEQLRAFYREATGGDSA